MLILFLHDIACTFTDEFLNDLVVLLDRSDDQEQDSESNREKLKEELWKRLEKKETELQATLESGRASESDAGRSYLYQEKLLEQLQKLAGRLRGVENVTSVEDYKAVEVCVCMHVSVVHKISCICVSGGV